MLTIMDGQIPGTTPGGGPVITTAGIHPGIIRTHGTIPGGMIHGTDGAGEIPSGTEDGHGTIPGIHLAGILTHGGLITDITMVGGTTTATTGTTIPTVRSLGVEVT